MEMTYEELNARLTSLELKIDGVFKLVTRINNAKQSEIMDVKQIASMLGLSNREIYNKQYLLPNFGECDGKKERRYLERAKKNSV